MRDFHGSHPGAWLAISLMVALVTACGGGHRLAEYEFGGRTLGVVSYAPNYPVLWTPRADIADPRADPVGAVIGGGTSAATEAAGRTARVRLDSAALRHDFAHDLTARTLARTARYLGDYSADVITEELRKDLRQVRRDRRRG